MNEKKNFHIIYLYVCIYTGRVSSKKFKKFENLKIIFNYIIVRYDFTFKFGTSLSNCCVRALIFRILYI